MNIIRYNQYGTDRPFFKMTQGYFRARNQNTIEIDYELLLLN